MSYQTPTAAMAARQVLPVENFPGIFCDAWVLHGSDLVFVSLIGREGKIMSLYGNIVARLCNALQVDGRRLEIRKELDKRQTKMPPTCRYGKDCVHAMLYAPIIAGNSTYHQVLLGNTGDDELWSVLNRLSPLGLLPHWRTPLLAALRETDMINALPSHGVDACLLDLGDYKRYQQLVTTLIKDGRLTGEAA